MFTVNYVNVTIWVLGAVLGLILCATIIWRVAMKNKNAGPARVSKASRDLIDLSQSLDQVYDIPSLVNILFKNRFAQSKQSLIPLLAFTNHNAYLILNPIRADLKSQFLVEQSFLQFTFRNKTQTFSLQKTNEVLRFFKSLKLNVAIIIPACKEARARNVLFCPLEEIGDYIKSDQTLLNQTPVQGLMQKINRLNLLQRKPTKRGRDG